MRERPAPTLARIAARIVEPVARPSSITIAILPHASVTGRSPL